jgi:hypothetical protein
VNFNTKLKEAASFGQPITEYDPGSRGYKDFINLARELMGHRPTDVEPALADARMSRPAELVQRAKQLAQLTSFQFGRSVAKGQPTAAPVSSPAVPVAAGNGNGNGNGNAHHGNGNGNGFSALEEVVSGAASVRPDAFSRRIETKAFGEDEPEEQYEPEHAAPRAGGASGALSTGGATATLSPPAATPKTIEQKIEAFYGVKQVGEEVVFSAKFEDATKVMIAGDFNNWMPISTPMQRSGDGRWQMRIPLPKGRYRYRLVVDGRWITDPNNKYVETNQYGELNNVVEVD